MSSPVCGRLCVTPAACRPLGWCGITGEGMPERTRLSPVGWSVLAVMVGLLIGAAVAGYLIGAHGG